MFTHGGFFVAWRNITRAWLPDNALFCPPSMRPQLPWLEPDSPFPPPESAWGADAPAPGLLAAGGSLDAAHLRAAYGQGTFPWYGPGQPILWWAPDPRMVLPVADFKLHRSLRKTLQAFRASAVCEIKVDSAFDSVIRACATKERGGQTGTWIVPEMIAAYRELHACGCAHSVETWVNGQLVGGLYCVALGQAVFGESMFAHATDASKIALAALVSLCRHHGVVMIDCQQNTAHLASLGAHEIPRADFLAHVRKAQDLPAFAWKFDPVYWNELLPPTALSA
jgi:leucyl/phenylalanyl-tRNA--protein transferase